MTSKASIIIPIIQLEEAKQTFLIALSLRGSQNLMKSIKLWV